MPNPDTELYRHIAGETELLRRELLAARVSPALADSRNLLDYRLRGAYTLARDLAEYDEPAEAGTAAGWS
jgi:hypothetical protein